MSSKKPPKRIFFYADSRAGIDDLFMGTDREEMQKEEPRAKIVEYRLVEKKVAKKK